MNGNTKRKGFITEEDVSMLLQSFEAFVIASMEKARESQDVLGEGDHISRYQAPIILTLLQEVAQVATAKIDWQALVKKTSTGITCPREYQMLWRHLAYHDTLAEKLEDAEPVDDDSDLDFELEAFPLVSCEASMEAAACVKVLMSSSLPNDFNTSNRPTVVAPLTINIPNGQALHQPSDKCQASCSRGMNITVPVSVQKQSLPAMMPAEATEGNGPSSSRQPAKKKRKLWTKEEDMALISAVQKLGEGNWQNILKEDFKHDRTASQLSQRWSILRKNFGKSNAGSTNNSNSSALTEAQLSTRQAISMALNMPMIGSFSAICSGKANPGNGTGSTLLTTTSTTGCPTGQPGPSETTPLCQKGVNQSVQAAPQGTQKTGGCSVNKSQTAQVKPSGPIKPLTGPSTLIQKAAFAAGGRIATPSTAASLFKAAQSKNAVHIRPGVSLAMTPVPGVKPSVSPVVSRPANVSQSWPLHLGNPSVMTRAGSNPGSQQAMCSATQFSTQPSDLLQPASQQHMEERKVAVPILEDAQGNVEQIEPSKGGGKIMTMQQKTAINHNQVPVVNLDDGDDMDVVVETSGQSQNSEQQMVKTTDFVSHSQLETSNEKCATDDVTGPAKVKIQRNPGTIAMKNSNVIDDGSSMINPADS